MATQITIPSPVLQVGEHFAVRWRLVPGGAWTAVAPDPTNAPFALMLPPGGRYEVEARVVLSGGQECPPVSYFVTPTTCDCPQNTDAALVRNTTGQVSLRISYDSVPPCGFTLTYGPGSTPGGAAANYQTVPLNPPPGSSAMSFPVTGDDYDVILYVNCCDGPPVYCFEKRIWAPAVPPVQNCTPYGLPETTHTLRLEYDATATIWRIKIVRKVPPDPDAPTQCGSIQIQARQQVNPGYPQNSVTVMLTDTDFAFQTNAPGDTAYFEVQPIPASAMPSSAGDFGLIYYACIIVDCCRVGWQYLGMTDAYKNTSGFPYWGDIANPA